MIASIPDFAHSVRICCNVIDQNGSNHNEVSRDAPAIHKDNTHTSQSISIDLQAY